MRRGLQRLRRTFATLGHPSDGLVVRGIRLRHRHSPLNGIGSISHGGRYNPKGKFEAHYFSVHADTVLREVGLVQPDPPGGTITVPTEPIILMTLEYDCRYCVDLTDTVILSELEIERDALLEEWTLALLKGETPMTHVIGTAARGSGIEALRVPSARHESHDNIVVFPDQMLQSSFVRITSPTGFDPDVLTEIRGTKKRR